ncbi:MAG: DUF1007 family protein [Campylobacterota bacterium]|nr:DUF1007 family protein [Campylobacterota bacterium]
MKILLATLGLLVSLYAHPHTFIEVYPTIHVKENSTSTVHFKWMLDDMTSAMLIMELDHNSDGKISENENSLIYTDYFSIFKDYSYYTYIKVKNRSIHFPEPQNFKASIENNKVCYSFDIEIHDDIQDTSFEFGDSDFYVAMVLKEEFVKASGLSTKVTGVDNDFYYGYKLELK